MPPGALNACIVTSPFSSGGITACIVVACGQDLGFSQTMWQRGFGHSAGFVHSQSHWGSSQTFLQGWGLGQFSMHIGSVQEASHFAQSFFPHCLFGQTTAHDGWSHFVSQAEVSFAWQRVSQRGGLHFGSQTWSHVGVWHCHVHVGAQAPPPGAWASKLAAAVESGRLVLPRKYSVVR